MKAVSHFAGEQHVGASHQRHALVVSHECPDHRDFRTLRDAAAREVERLVKAVSTSRADGMKMRKIERRRRGVHHRRERGGVRCNHGALAQSALEPKTWYAKVGVLVGKFQV